MVDVGAKPEVERRAVARAFVETTAAARLRSLPKGDALVTAQLAGIMAVTINADLIQHAAEITVAIALKILITSTIHLRSDLPNKSPLDAIGWLVTRCASGLFPPGVKWLLISNTAIFLLTTCSECR